MHTLAEVTAALERIAPSRLAAEWDSVGLLVGTRRDRIERVMTCLTLTPDVAREAVREAADLVVTHHPLPFRPVARITDDSPTGRVLLELIGAGIGVWSSHTAWDSAAGGINDQLAALLGLDRVTPIEPDPLTPLAGFGRVGHPPADWTLDRLRRHLQSPAIASTLGIGGVQVAGDPDRPARRVGVVCGSGGDAVAALKKAGCDTLVTGEVRLHGGLDCLAHGIAVVAIGHHASERFAMDALARRIGEALPGLRTFSSRDDRDPLPFAAPN